MKFTQISTIKWWDVGGRRGYTLFALGEDGKVYKSLTKGKQAQHLGWLEMSGEVLPPDFEAQREKAAQVPAPMEEVTADVA